MEREALKDINDWYRSKRRKPLLIRGARQVGKTTLVRMFAKENGLILYEINLERHLELKEDFKSNDPQRIMQSISVILRREIDIETGLLFFDEIQAIPEAVEALRYFYEDLPNLALIASGSLLEFTLADYDLHMPVGRIQYLFLGPLSFREFLYEINRPLYKFITTYDIRKEYSDSIHNELSQLVKLYSFTGGMPEAVQAYIDGLGLMEVERVQNEILYTYEDDFNKYRKTIDAGLMQSIFRKLSVYVGKKVKYVNYSKETRSEKTKRILDMFSKALILTNCYTADCSGIPLDGTSDFSTMKTYLVDVGLMNRQMGLDCQNILNQDETQLINAGAIAEQMISQHLMYFHGNMQKPHAFYWLKENKKGNAEVDFVIQKNSNIIPVEVKAGKSGTLKSLHLFMKTKQDIPYAVRFDLNKPSIFEVDTLLHDGSSVKYQLISLPIYLVSELGRLLEGLA